MDTDTAPEKTDTTPEKNAVEKFYIQHPFFAWTATIIAILAAVIGIVRGSIDLHDRFSQTTVLAVTVDAPTTPMATAVATGFAAELANLEDDAFILFATNPSHTSSDKRYSFECLGLYADGTVIDDTIADPSFPMDTFHNVVKWFSRYNYDTAFGEYKLIEDNHLQFTIEAKTTENKKVIMDYSGSVEIDGTLLLESYNHTNEDRDSYRFVPIGVVSNGILDVYEDFDMSKF